MFLAQLISILIFVLQLHNRPVIRCVCVLGENMVAIKNIKLRAQLIIVFTIFYAYTSGSSGMIKATTTDGEQVKIEKKK